jgi:hypothetical protein
MLFCLSLSSSAQPAATAYSERSQTSTTSIQQPSVALPSPRLDAVAQLEGRLFFSRQERQVMDKIRQRAIVPGAVGTDQEPALSMLNGFVKRSDSQVTVWVDGQARGNVPGSEVRDLKPQDVGGSAEAIKVLDSYPSESASKRSMKPKGALKKVIRRVFAKRSPKK